MWKNNDVTYYYERKHLKHNEGVGKYLRLSYRVGNIILDSFTCPFFNLTALSKTLLLPRRMR